MNKSSETIIAENNRLLGKCAGPADKKLLLDGISALVEMAGSEQMAERIIQLAQEQNIINNDTNAYHTNCFFDYIKKPVSMIKEGKNCVGYGKSQHQRQGFFDDQMPFSETFLESLKQLFFPANDDTATLENGTSYSST